MKELCLFPEQHLQIGICPVALVGDQIQSIQQLTHLCNTVMCRHRSSATIIEIGNDADGIGKKITSARNYQNVVRGVDFAALDFNQERLRQELKVAGVTYFYRPSAEARARRDDAFTLEEAAVAMACIAFKVRTSAELMQQPKPVNAIDFVVVAKKEIGRLWDQGGALYGQLFPAGLSGVRVCRSVRIM